MTNFIIDHLDMTKTTARPIAILTKEATFAQLLIPTNAWGSNSEWNNSSDGDDLTPELKVTSRIVHGEYPQIPPLHNTRTLGIGKSSFAGSISFTLMIGFPKETSL